jgi:putative SOS response-associated peptidase YedK
VCNLYSLNKGQDALRRFFKITSDETGNQLPLPGIYPATLAPIVRSGGGGRVTEQMRWGFPPLAGANGLVTNVRKAASSYRRTPREGIRAFRNRGAGAAFVVHARAGRSQPKGRQKVPIG